MSNKEELTNGGVITTTVVVLNSPSEISYSLYDLEVRGVPLDLSSMNIGSSV